MKRGGVLHPELARVIASMGHTDLLCVADAGLPIPPGVERIDLAFARGRPAFLEVVTAIVGELVVEGYTLAEESRTHCPELIDALAQALPEAEVTWVPHEELKRLSHTARAIVRTGEFTPYANVLLRSGVDFG
jgi:D-ribose pyranase